MFKRFAQILALTVPLLLVACNSGTTSTTSASTGTTTTTSASYSGTYTGTTTGVNGGPTTMVVASDKSIKGTFTINNRTNDNGAATIYEATFEGTVDSSGKISVNSFLEGALVMIFTGQIDSNGLLTGTYYEAAHPGDPAKSGSFSLQGPKNGSTTTTTTSSSGGAKSCTGSYVGNYSPPDHDERIRLRNLSLAGRGIAVTGNDAIDNGNAGGGDPDGGIWMAGSFAFETDGNCNVIKGQTFVFYAYEYGISGVVVKGGTSNLIWSGQGSQGDMQMTVDSNNNIGGQFFHPAPDNFVYGVLSGTFTPNGKI
ncbi:MAG: hypothetical protein ABL923_02140 [Burkholderiaceae bacterium]